MDGCPFLQTHQPNGREENSPLFYWCRPSRPNCPCIPGPQHRLLRWQLFSFKYQIFPPIRHPVSGPELGQSTLGRSLSDKFFLQPFYNSFLASSDQIPPPAFQTSTTFSGRPQPELVPNILLFMNNEEVTDAECHRGGSGVTEGALSEPGSSDTDSKPDQLDWSCLRAR